MRYTYLCPDGRSVSHDCELNLTHIVFGQRDIKPDEAKMPPREKVITDPVVQEMVYKFKDDERRGWYRLKPLAWCESEEDAAKMVERFKAEGRINIEVVKIDQTRTLTHA